MRHLAVSALGRDRPGIVAAVTGALLSHELNIEDSQMTILRGHFTMMLVVSGSDALDAEELRASLDRVALELELEAISVAEVADAGGAPPDPDHIATVYGADHPGIVHAVAAALAKRGANILDLETRVAGDLYVMTLDVVSESDVEETLRPVAAEQGVEVTVRPFDADVL